VNRPAAKPVLLSRIRHRLARPLARVAFSLVLIAMLVAGSVAAAMPMGSSAQPDAVVDAVPPCHGESPSQAPDARDHGCCDMACGCAVLHAAAIDPAQVARVAPTAATPAMRAASEPGSRAAIPPLRPPIRTPA